MGVISRPRHVNVAHLIIAVSNAITVLIARINLSYM